MNPKNKHALDSLGGQQQAAPPQPQSGELGPPGAPATVHPPAAPQSDQDGSIPNSPPSTTGHPPDWAFLLEKTEGFATREIARYCWREVEGGVLPGGYDASSIAAEAVAELLRDQKAQSLIQTPQELRKHLRKRARKIINRLHHRMENEFMVSECDLDPIFHEDGEVIGALETFPGAEADPAEEAIRHADAERLQDLKQEFIVFLGEDQLLKDLFGCLCDGIQKRAAIARKLNVSGAVIKNAQARLDRRLLEFRSHTAALLAAA